MAGSKWTAEIHELWPWHRATGLRSRTFQTCAHGNAL